MPALPAPHRFILQQLPQGYCLLELLFDDAVTDGRVLEVNAAYVQLTGFADAVGRTLNELLPHNEAYWLTLLQEAAHTRQPQHVELPAPQLGGRWFDLYALPSGEGPRPQVAVLFTDITERRRREANLDFLAVVSDALMRLTNIEQTMNALGQQLAAHLGLSACVFSEMSDAGQTGLIRYGWFRPGVPDLRGTYRMAEFVTPELLHRYQRGEAIVIRDVFTDAMTDGAQYTKLGIGAFASMPLLQAGEWPFLLMACHSEAHDWRADELYLLRETATRLWLRLERAHAEEAQRASQAQYQLLLDTIDDGLGLGELLRDDAGQASGWRFLELNAALTRHTGPDPVASAGPLFSDLFPATDRGYWLELYQQVVDTHSPRTFEQYWAPVKRWLAGTVTPAGGQRFSLILKDVTLLKQAEEAEQLRQRLQQQQQQVKAVLGGQEEERRRIAESLHNGIGQVLYATKLQLDQLPARPDEPARAEAKYLLDEAIRQARAISHELTPGLLVDFGLQKALETICQQLGSPGLRWHCYVDVEEAPALPLVLQQAVYRLVQGLAHNVAKHAQARQVTLEVTALPDWLAVHLEDDGRGFDPATVQDGLGLRTLRSRVALLGGTLRLESAPGQGTLIEVRLPLAALAAS